MSFLADTNILSAAAPTKTSPDHALRAWLDLRAEAISISAITIFEIEDGIARLFRKGAVQKASALRRWLDGAEAAFAGRILPVDAQVARCAGLISDRARGAGVTVGYPDILIAATAVCNDLTVLTRNLRHFAPLGVKAIDPAAGLPA